MSSYRLFFGIRIPGYNLMHLDIEDRNKSVFELKKEISEKIRFPFEEIEFLLQGNVLENNENISEICPNSLIHVLKKFPKYKPYSSTKTYTKADFQGIAAIFGSVTNVAINVGGRINILAHIISEYPEFRRNLGAQALIRDSVLFHSLNKPKVIEKIAENYSIVCDAAEYIVKITIKELTKFVGVSCDDSSDTTSSSEEENSNANQSEQARIRRISHDQLAAALSAIIPSSMNSLSNIAQRNSNLAEQEQREREQAANPNSEEPTSTPNRISSSLLNNALIEALMIGASSVLPSPQTQQPQQQPIASENMDTAETQDQVATNNNELPLRHQNHEHSSQMQIMRDIGLTDDELNFSVLVVTNGNVENAINLILFSSELAGGNNV